MLRERCAEEQEVAVIFGKEKEEVKNVAKSRRDRMITAKAMDTDLVKTGYWSDEDTNDFSWDRFLVLAVCSSFDSVVEAQLPGFAKNSASTESACAVSPDEAGSSWSGAGGTTSTLEVAAIAKSVVEASRQNQYSWSHPMQLDLLGP